MLELFLRYKSYSYSQIVTNRFRFQFVSNYLFKNSVINNSRNSFSYFNFGYSFDKLVIESVYYNIFLGSNNVRVPSFFCSQLKPTSSSLVRFNPYLSFLFTIPAVYLRKFNIPVAGYNNFTNKAYYDFVKGRNDQGYFGFKFLSFNFINFNVNTVTIEPPLFANFFFDLAVIDFRSVFLRFTPFFTGDYFGSSDSPEIIGAENFAPDFVFENRELLPVGATAVIDEQDFLRFEQFDLFVYDDAFDYRVQHRVFPRSVYASLLPVSIKSFPRFYTLVSSNFLSILSFFNVEAAHFFKFSPKPTDKRPIFDLVTISWFQNNARDSGLCLSDTNLNTHSPFRQGLVRSILLLIWEVYHSNIELFVSANNSIYFLLQRFPGVRSDFANLRKFIDIFVTANIDYRFFSKQVQKSVLSFVESLDKFNFFKGFEFINCGEIEFFIDEVLFQFSQMLQTYTIDNLIDVFHSVKHYSAFLAVSVQNRLLQDPVFSTSFLSYLQILAHSSQFSEFLLEPVDILVKDFNDKFSSKNSSSQFYASGSYNRVFNGLDFSYLDNPDFVLIHFEYLFRQIHMFESFISLELNLFSLVSAVSKNSDQNNKSAYTALFYPFLVNNWHGGVKAIKDCGEQTAVLPVFASCFPVCSFSKSGLDVYKSFLFLFKSVFNLSGSVYFFCFSVFWFVLLVVFFMALVFVLIKFVVYTRLLLLILNYLNFFLR